MSTPPRPPKTIVLAFDGTANNFGCCNTNVIRLFSMLEKEMPEEQIVYYQPGLGTYLASEAAWSPTEKAISELMDKAFALYLDVHIMDGYRFLMANYKRNDRVCMFGFSRGAYTARCLAGMLKKVGLLLPGNDQMVASAYERYRDLSLAGNDLTTNFRDAFCIDCPIELLGLWDTVSSVGLVHSKHLPLTASNSSVKTVRHALALDERRAKFKPNRWHQSSADCPDDGPWRKLKKALTFWSVRLEDHGALDAQNQPGSTKSNVMEVWFAGDHSDVGGGHKLSQSSISNPSLAWMISQIILSKAPIRFKRKDSLKVPVGFEFHSVECETVSGGTPFDPNGGNGDTTRATGNQTVTFESRNGLSGSNDLRIKEGLAVPGGNIGGTTLPTHEEMKNFQQKDKGLDATGIIHDPISENWLWGILEGLPFRHSTGYTVSTGWRRSNWPNFGRGRKITTHHVYIHESVLLRMESPAGYVPKAKFWGLNPDITFVDDADRGVGKGELQNRDLVRAGRTTPCHFRLSSSVSF